MKHQIEFILNGKKINAEVEPNTLLLELLRDKLNLTGTKEGCGNGECGACTILVNDIPVRACLMLAVESQGSTIMTIEGIGSAEKLDKIQEAFIESGAIQCGYCSPGFIMATKALLIRYPKPTHSQIIEALSGHLCRCTGYEPILNAVKKSANS